MSDYPMDFFEEILRRVPLKPLILFRLVCKLWKEIVDNPRFSRSHVRNQIGDDQIIIRNKSGNILYKLSLDSICYRGSRFSEIPLTRVKAKDLEISIYPGFSRIVPVASCDGLILFGDHHRVPRALWNPLTREYLQLPLLDEIVNAVEEQELPSLGIGYDSENDDYKVARVSQVIEEGGSYVLRTLVYSVKSDSWSRIGDFRNCYALCFGHGVFVNGEVYWVANVGEKERVVESIIALDFETEAYRVVPLPPASPCLLEKKLDVLGGCLFLSYFNGKGRLDGWMMTCSEGVDLWKKVFSFAEFQRIGICGSLVAVAYLKSRGMVLIQHDQNEFIWLDIENKTTKKVALNGLRKHLISQFYQESAVRLNESGRVDAVRCLDPAKRKSLKLSLSISNAWNGLDVWKSD